LFGTLWIITCRGQPLIYNDFYKFNFKIRLKTILPQRFNDFFAHEPSRQIEDSRRLDSIEGQISQIRQKLKHLGEWKDNVDNFLDAIKNAQPNAERPHRDDNLVYKNF
jgi:hypothetical protein